MMTTRSPFVLTIACILVLLHHAAVAQDPPLAASPPNIILFIVDDMGWQDTSVPFHVETTPLNRKYHTPNMERLAAQGMKFRQAFACAVCSPTRISLMTGLNAARHRVTNWTLRRNQSPDGKHPRLTFPQWNVNGLSPVAGVERTIHTPLLPQLLHEAGYRTIHVGKAHFGATGTPAADPRSMGFDVNIGGHPAGGPGSFLGTQNFSAAFRKGDRIWDVPGLDAYHGKDIFLTEALTLEANKAVDAAVRDRKPFFLYLSHYAVHVPFAPDQRFYPKYRDAGLDHTEAMYAALVEGMDKSLGDIMDNVRRHGLTDDTIILFVSDNGGLSAHGRGGKPHTHNLPLSSGKGSAHEGGIRVPMIVRWPGITKPASTCDDYLIIEDFFPTLLDMARITSQPKVDGISFVPLLKGEHAGSANQQRSLIWHFPNEWGPAGPGIGASSTIRQGDWKLIHYHDPGRKVRDELFNIAADLGETKNLINDEPAIAARLSRLLGERLIDMDAQRPVETATKQVIPWPGLDQPQLK